LRCNPLKPRQSLHFLTLFSYGMQWLLHAFTWRHAGCAPALSGSPFQRSICSSCMASARAASPAVSGHQRKRPSESRFWHSQYPLPILFCSPLFESPDDRHSPPIEYPQTPLDFASQCRCRRSQKCVLFSRGLASLLNELSLVVLDSVAMHLYTHDSI